MPSHPHVRAYGDTTGDGMVQLSFTLPLPAGPRAEAAAAVFARKMGIDPALVVHAKAVGEGFTFFVVYGRSSAIVDLDEVTVAERDYPLLATKEVNLEVRSRLRRKLVVVGATVGTDAHTVGLDAILNVKGYAGEKGLEHYRELRVVNLGAQVPAERLVARAAAEQADAVLVSQVVTQRDAHHHHVREVVEAFERGWPGTAPRPLLVAGGPRFDPSEAERLGVDRVFGKGTSPREVASYLVAATLPAKVA
ncbi:MAG TPA: OAM dimerization domain-containing protein [Mycobacteriales bacterium]|nr:OAM dimerization domain-containing protein [Mycobacteriales bacterium]